jgi:hypothetical protein
MTTTTTDQNGSEWLSGGPTPPTTEPVPQTAVVTPGPTLPIGIHPRDNTVPTTPGTPRLPPAGDSNTVDGRPLPAQGLRRLPPWNTDNEDAFAVNQRSASSWSAQRYTLNMSTQIAGRLKGNVSTKIWVPSGAASGVVIAPEQGDVDVGAGVTLNVGDSIELATEATVWAGPIPGQTTGTAYVVRLFNPPGGGLGLSAAG